MKFKSVGNQNTDEIKGSKSENLIFFLTEVNFFIASIDKKIAIKVLLTSAAVSNKQIV